MTVWMSVKIAEVGAAGDVANCLDAQQITIQQSAQCDKCGREGPPGWVSVNTNYETVIHYTRHNHNQQMIMMSSTFLVPTHMALTPNAESITFMTTKYQLEGWTGLLLTLTLVVSHNYFVITYYTPRSFISNSNHSLT